MAELKMYQVICTDDIDRNEITENFSAPDFFAYEADAVIRHHKYKRCLTMTEMCNARYDEEDAKVNGCGTSWEYISKEMKYWERWRNRWLKIAEKFKPNYSC